MNVLGSGVAGTRERYGKPSSPGAKESRAHDITSDWAQGRAAKYTYYGWDSLLVKTISSFDETEKARKNIREQLKKGNTKILPEPAGYNAQDRNNFLWNFCRDLCPGGTLSYPENASEGDRLRLALGSYKLSATVVSVDTKSRVAQVEFNGWNDTTLGSGIAVNGWFKDWVNEMRDGMGPDGNFARIRQEFGWRESLRW